MRPEPWLHPTTNLRHVIAIVVASPESYLIVVEASHPTQLDFHQLGADFKSGRDGQTILELCRCEVLIGSMHYERTPASEGVQAGCGAASAPLRCAGASLRCGGARGNCSGVSGAKELQEGIGKSAGEWQFTLRGRLALARMTFPPRRQLK